MGRQNGGSEPKSPNELLTAITSCLDDLENPDVDHDGYTVREIRQLLIALEERLDELGDRFDE
jgi:hypothetical protein